MTPLQFAHAECANFQPDSSCLGVAIGATGNIQSCRPEKRCKLVSGGCRYFEDCVMPMAKWQSDPRKAKLYQEAAHIYKLANPDMGLRSARRCECGETLDTKERKCPKCRREGRLKTFQKSNRKRRIPKCESLDNSYG